MNIRKWFAAALCTVTLLVFNLACASKPNQSATSAADNTPPINHIKHIIYIIRLLTRICKSMRFTRVFEFQAFGGGRRFWRLRSVGVETPGQGAKARGLLAAPVVPPA